jgi:hypothetical protein
MFSYAFKNVWNDPKIVAVTPFILNYPQAPFSEFSWKKEDGTFYPYYQAVKQMSKVKGEPIQIVSGQILGAFAQPVMLPSSDFVGAILAKNTGQSIWNAKDVFISSDSHDVLIRSYSFLDVEPTKLGLIVFKAAAPENPGIYSKSLFLDSKEGKRITNSFRIESLVMRVNKMQVGAFFARISSYLQNSLKFKF